MDISIIILTLNEELHIRRCIENIAPLARGVFVVDCFSTDKTVEIAKECGASVVQNPWPGAQSLQFNWALEHLPIRTKWVLRLDADEYLYPELVDEIRAKLDELPEEVTGVAFKRRHIFLGRWIKRGTYPVTLVRLFRYGKARSEQRLMDEHIELLEGRSVTFDGDFADDNLNDIGWWTAKHNGYALREAVDLLDLEYGLLPEGETTESTEDEVAVSSGSQQYGGRVPRLEGQAAEKRGKKMKYARMPLFWRAFAYFCYRYFLRGGFLEGSGGFLWHFLQGWWYRTLVDAKVWEIKRASGGDPQKMLALLRDKYGMKI
jgi:glycosyltransferase involved in cell wall biosynthesis